MVDEGFWSDISNTSTTFSEIPLSAGIWNYRALIKSGTFEERFSDTLSILVLPKEVITNPIDGQSKLEGEPDPVLKVWV